MPLKQKRIKIALVLLLVLIPATLLWAFFALDNQPYYFIAMLLILYAILPFALSFERRRPQAREIVLLAVLCALVVAGRAAFFFVPQFKPMLAMVILFAIPLGAESGFLIGVLSAFVSNFFFGQGPWTLWQMFCFGLCGFCSGLFFGRKARRPKRLPLCLFGAFCALVLYGGIMNPVSLLLSQAAFTWESLLTAYAMGFPFDCVHALATVVFLFILSGPILDKLERIQRKYGLLK